MKAQQKILAVVIGGAFAASAGAANAAENPFAFKPLASGYMVADNHAGGEKMKDGKCGTGKCGGEMKKKAATGEKAKEGNCSAEMKDKEGNCSAEMKAKAEEKAKEGKCGGEKMKDGNCSAEMKKK
jgi:uncharacterized low-complexity protein